MDNKIHLTPTKEKVANIAILIFVICLFFVSYFSLGLNKSEIYGSLHQASAMFGQFIHPDWSILSRVLDGMLISLAISFVSVVISIFFALPISFLGANNITISSKLATVIKSLVAVLRSVPTLVWGLMVIASIGFGNVGGVLTMIFILNTFLIRAFTGSIESIGTDIIEALKSTGTPWPMICIKGVLPTIFPSIIAWIAISFEMAVAVSISLGMIGITGIGKVVMDSLAQYEYDEASVGILVIFITMYFIEMSTVKIKSSIKNEK